MSKKKKNYNPPNFKQWVKMHNPKLKWDFNNPENLKKQLNDVIKVSGNIELEYVFQMFFCIDDPGLTLNQQGKFIDWSNNRYEKGF